MGKRQTRRSISIKGTTYTRWRAWCESQGQSMSGRLEEIMASDMDAGNAPKIVTPLTVPTPVKQPVQPITGAYSEIADKVFQ